MVLLCCSGPGWPALDTLRGRLFLVWTPESFHDYLNLYPNLENALCFVSSVDGNSGDDGGTTVTDPAGVFIQTYDGLSWSSPVTAAEIAAFESRVSLQIPVDRSTPDLLLAIIIAGIQQIWRPWPQALHTRATVVAMSRV